MKKNWLTGRVTGFDPIPRLAHIFALALALFIAPGAWAVAPTPTVVWDGDFSSLTKTVGDVTYTIRNVTGTGTSTTTANSVGSDKSYLQIANSDNGVAAPIITATGDNSAFGNATDGATVLIFASGMPLTEGSNRALLLLMDNTGKYGRTTSGTTPTAYSRFGIARARGNNYGGAAAGGFVLDGSINTVAAPVNLEAYTDGKQSIVLTYKSSSGLKYYVDGALKGEYNPDTNFTPTGVCIGGVDYTSSNWFYAQKSMKIHAIAIFNRELTAEEIAEYEAQSRFRYCDAIAWRNADGGSTQFHASTFASVGSIGEVANSTTRTYNISEFPWDASFSSGKLPVALIYDQADKQQATDCTFGPIWIGGMYVNAVPSSGNYTLGQGSNPGARTTYLGDKTGNHESWFVFNKSYTINRAGNSSTADTLLYGTVNMYIEADKTFTLNSGASTSAKNLVMTAGTANTADPVFRMSGGGKLVVPHLNASAGTLDFSGVTAAPFIQGDLTVTTDTKFVFPAELAANTAYTLCSGTLSGPEKMICDIVVGTTVKENVTLTFSGNTVSYDDTVVYSATVSGTAVTWLDGSAPASLDNATVNFSGSGVVTGLSGNGTTINTSSDVTVDVTSFTSPTLLGSGTYRYTSSYPTVVPTAEYSYEYVASGTSTQIDGVTVNGTLKTSGNIVLASFRLNAGGTLDVLSDVTMMQAAVQKALSGNMTVRAGATLTNLQTADGYNSDAVNYDQTGMRIEVYGTLALGQTRWRLRQKNYHEFRLHDTAVISGTGDGDGALDWIESCGGMFDVYDGTATVSANMRVRSGATTANWVQNGAKLKFTGSISGAGAFSKSGAGTLSLSGTHTQTGGVSVSEGTIELDNVSYTSGTITLSSANGAPTLKMIATDSSTTVSATVNVPANTRGSLAFEGAGTFALSGPSVSGNTVWLGSDLSDGALMLNGAVSINNGSRGRTYTINKIAGGSGNLGIAAWSAAYDSNDTALTYVVNTIAADNYSGTIALANVSTDTRNSTFVFSVGDIIGTAVYGTPIVKVTTNATAKASGSNIINVNVSATKLNGSAAAFLYDGSVVGSEGIYLAEATYDNINYKTLQAAYDAAQNAAGDISDIIVYNNSATAPTGCALVDNGNGTYAVRAAGEVYWTAGYWATGGNTKISVVTSDGRSTTVVSGDTVVVDDRTSDTAYVAGTLIGGFSSVRIARDTTMASGAGSDTIFDGVTVTIDSAKTLTFIPSNWHNIIIGSTVFNGNAVVLSDNASASKTLTVSGAVTGSATVNIAGTVTIASTGSIANAIVLADGATLVVQSGGSVPTPTTNVAHYRVKTVTSGGTTTYSVEAIPGTTFTVY